MTREEISAEARKVLAQHYDVPLDSVGGNTTLGSLGGDSLTVIEAVMSLEDAFEVEIPDEVITEWRTFGHVVEYLCKRMGAE